MYCFINLILFQIRLFSRIENLSVCLRKTQAIYKTNPMNLENKTNSRKGHSCFSIKDSKSFETVTVLLLFAVNNKLQSCLWEPKLMLFEKVLRNVLEDCKTELLARLWVVGKIRCRVWTLKGKDLLLAFRRVKGLERWREKEGFMNVMIDELGLEARQCWLR